MNELNREQMTQYSGGAMEIVIIYEKVDAYCGIQRIYADGDLYSMRLICD